MTRSPHVHVRIDLSRIRANLEAITRRVGVPIITVIKADAYGLGADRVAPAIADLVERFCVFSLEEATAIDLWKLTGKPALAIGPPEDAPAEEYIANHVHPAVSDASQASRLRAAGPVLCVDTGQQRFACPLDRVDEVLEAGGCEEAFTHAATLAQVHTFTDAVRGKVARMHAAGSSLLHEREAWLDAVRPGLAIFQGAVRITTRLIETHKSSGPAGYSGFVAPFHGVILAGYSNGLRPGPCLVGGRPSRILEVGMQSAFVETTPDDRPGDEVTLVGNAITERQVADAWGTGPHEALVRLAGCGTRSFAG